VRLLQTVTLPILLLASLALAQEPAPDCRDWQACREEALSAAARADYETFHDLAWRAVQTRGRRDPELMYLLARAQSLSGRPHDALVMLSRLAEMGVTADADEAEDFRRVRALSGWPDVKAALERAAQAPSQAVTIDTGGEPAATLEAPSVPAAEPRSGSVDAKARPVPTEAPAGAASTEVARFPAPPFVAGGLAYDSASRRFVIGNLPDRKLTVVGDGLNRSATLAGAAAGFLGSVNAIDIDRARGDLWVVSGAASPDGSAGASSALHKLQLISGRVLSVFAPEEALKPVRLIDLGVTAAGSVMALDAEGPRLLTPDRDGRSLGLLMNLPDGEATSLALRPDGSVAYVAYADRLLRLDLSRRTTTAVASSDAGAPLGLERLRWHRDTLVGLQRTADGARRLVQIRLSKAGTRLLSVTLLDSSTPAQNGATALAVFGQEAYYLVPSPGGGEAVIRRVPLR
jgi:hypothetical protein